MNDGIDELVRKMREAIEKEGGVEIFNREEVVAIRKVIRLVDMLESWGKLGKFALWAMTVAAGILISYEQIASRIVGK